MTHKTTIVPLEQGTAEYPLSWFQERMWLLNRKKPEDLSYDIPVVFLLEGEINIDALNRSITEILRRHETLRARFTINNRGEPVQIISPCEPFTLPIIEVQESDVPRYIEENMRYVFDLEKGPIIIGSLLVINSQRHLLLLNVHHIAADGWSVESILFSELQECYEAFSSGNAQLLKQLPVQYTDFAAWQRRIDLTRGLKFWEKHLSGYESSLELPSDYLRTPQSGSTSGRLEYRYSAEFSQALEKFAQSHGCTMFMCLLAGFALTVNRYTGKEDLCIGTTTSGRILPEIEKLIGFFINILPLRISIDDTMTVKEFMNHVRSIALAGYDHQIVPYERIVYSSIVERSDTSSQLVPLVIRHQNFPRTHLEKNLPGGIKFGSYPGYEGYRTATGKDAIARCEVELSYTGDRNKLDVEVMYASDLYRPETILQLLNHHEQLLREMMSGSQRLISELSMLTETDRQRLFIEFNQTKQTTEDGTFVTRWDEQVQKTPDSIACYDSFGSWTYRDIATVANILAKDLVEKGLKQGDIIGVCMERNAPLLSTYLAIWKAGAAYVPLDPSYPETYLNQITSDSQPKFIICTQDLVAKLGIRSENCCVVDAKLNAHNGWIPSFSAVTLTPDSLAYVMYTSGSTGIPKGARVPHRQLMNWLGGIDSRWPFSSDEVVAQKTTIAFAVSVKEIFAGLLNGCPLVFIGTEAVKDPVLFVDALRRFKATRVNLVPSHLMAVLSYMKKENIELPALRICTTAGEPLTAEMVVLFRSLLPQALLLNNYGCTELNDMTYYDTTDFDGSHSFVPVGKPIQNTQMYVLDRCGRPVPVGVPGEVHVATIGMALGYHNLQEFTRERFIANPFGKEYDGILYNTGDVVRYLPDGNLEFLGRWDFQVKIRGFRVDVRHVEKVMGEFEGIGTRAVIGEKGQLLAFYLQAPGSTIDVGKLREFLEQRLPHYMVPTTFVALREMPKLPNGKLNRRALKVASGAIQQSDTYEAPSTETEKILADIWSEVLEIPEERIGKRSHFFELGGHSLSATRFIARVKERMGIEIGLSLVFENPRLNEIASNLTTTTKAQDNDDDAIIQKPAKSVAAKRSSGIPGLLDGKVVLVTGGSRGIGRSAVRLLASQGASVAINYLKSSDQAQMVKEIIDEDGGVAEIFQGDTTDPQQVNELVKNVQGHFGKIDVLVANAAIGFKVAPFVQYDWADFERKLTNEIKSIFLLTQAVVPEMIAHKSGSIIAVSSTMSKHAQPGYSAHGAAKAALDSFVRSIANELGPDGIRINTVAPGLTLTDATAPMANQIKDTAATRCPLRRNGLPRDIAGAILFLA
ncbi:MAG TPA: amino acid adenylation domain-containing protein, partial [Chitinispirillaceae bacterium]|nr:amino acid adenylation domain-containing protein [Chitinispirillaceae bacterium]